MYSEVVIEYRRQMKEKLIFDILCLHPEEISLLTCHYPSDRFSPMKVELWGLGRRGH